MKQPPTRRIFVVGSPRSGTTLLQCLVASHSQVFSLPETSFFADLVSWQRRHRLLGIASPKQRHWYCKLLALVEPPPTVHPPQRPVFVRQYATAFIDLLDGLARHHGKTAWVEKTPRHIERIDVIEKYVPRVQFLHILRNGPDNIASHCDVIRRYPDRWHADFDLDYCIRQWIDHARMTLKHGRKPNHLVVGYRQMVENTQEVLVRVCDFVGLPYEERMLRDYADQSERVTKEFEQWKSGVKQAIHNRDGTKFYEIFSEQEQQHILKCVSAVDLSPLGEI